MAERASEKVSSKRRVASKSLSQNFSGLCFQLYKKISLIVLNLLAILQNVDRVPVPYIDRKVFACLASCRSPLFYNRKKNSFYVCITTGFSSFEWCKIHLSAHLFSRRNQRSTIEDFLCCYWVACPQCRHSSKIYAKMHFSREISIFHRFRKEIEGKVSETIL